MVIVSADRSAPSGAASAISFLHSSCFWSFETIVIQPEICLPDVGEIGTRWARWARWARSSPRYAYPRPASGAASPCGLGSPLLATAPPRHPRTCGEQEGNGAGVSACMRGHGSIHGSIHGIHARVLMYDEQPRAGLVTRVGRGDDRERRRVDGQLRVGTCAERGRRGEHVHACGAPHGSTVGTEPERARRDERLHACWAGTVSAHLPTLIASLIMQSSFNQQAAIRQSSFKHAISRQSSGVHQAFIRQSSFNHAISRQSGTYRLGAPRRSRRAALAGVSRRRPRSRQACEPRDARPPHSHRRATG